MDYKRYFTVVQIAEKWEISERRVRKHCQNKRVKGVRKEGGMYFIPRHAEKPVDLREYRGLDADRRKRELFQKLDAYRDKVYKLEFIDHNDLRESKIESIFCLCLYWGKDEAIRKRCKYLLTDSSAIFSSEAHIEMSNCRDDTLRRYKEANDYINHLAKKKVSIPGLIRKMYFMFEDKNEQDDCYRAIAEDDGEQISMSRKVEKSIRDYRKWKCHPVEKVVRFFFEFLSYAPLDWQSIPIGCFLCDFLLKQSGYPTILEWEGFEKLFNTYINSENLKPAIDYTVRLLRKRMREGVKNIRK